MAANKYIKQSGGDLIEQAATQVSTGAPDANKIVALDASGLIDQSMMPVGIGADTASIVSSENLAAGDLVNIHDASGTPKVRKADATSAGKEAHGFVLAAVTAPAAATVYFEGTNTQVSGLTGGKQFLATTAGLSDETPPATAGNVVQRVGIATAANRLNFESGTPITLA